MIALLLVQVIKSLKERILIFEHFESRKKYSIKNKKNVGEGIEPNAVSVLPKAKLLSTSNPSIERNVGEGIRTLEPTKGQDV